MFSRRKTPPKPPQPICGCKHHLSFHDPETGRCSFTKSIFTVRDEAVRDADGRPVLDSFRDVQTVRQTTYRGEHQCGCRRYIGPEPLTTYYAQEIVP